MFHVGIISLILTIIIQFREFWGKIPMPVYFFFIGVAIVGYVTFREIAKNGKGKNNIEINVGSKNNLNDSENDEKE